MKYILIFCAAVVVGLAALVYIYKTPSATVSRADAPLSTSNILDEINYRRAQAGVRALYPNRALQSATDSFAPRMAADKRNLTPTLSGVGITSLVDLRQYPVSLQERSMAWILLKSPTGSSVGEALDKEVGVNGSTGEQALLYKDFRSVGITVTFGGDGFIYTAILFGIL